MDPTYLEGRDGSLRAVNLEASLRNSAQGVFAMVPCSSETVCGGGVEQY